MVLAVKVTGPDQDGIDIDKWYETGMGNISLMCHTFADVFTLICKSTRFFVLVVRWNMGDEMCDLLLSDDSGAPERARLSTLPDLCHVSDSP